MAVSVVFYNNIKEQLLLGTHDFSGATFKCALCTSLYTPDIDTHVDFADITNEVVGTGYTAGGETLTTLAVVQDDANDRATWGFDDVTWANSTITARYGIIYQSTGAAATSELVAYIDFGADFSSSGTTFRIEPASGLFLALS